MVTDNNYSRCILCFLLFFFFNYLLYTLQSFRLLGYYTVIFILYYSTFIRKMKIHEFGYGRNFIFIIKILHICRNFCLYIMCFQNVHLLVFCFCYLPNYNHIYYYLHFIIFPFFFSTLMNR